MMELMEYQLKQALLNVECARKYVDNKRLTQGENEYLENYHYELLDMELRLKDMINHLHNL